MHRLVDRFAQCGRTEAADQGQHKAHHDDDPAVRAEGLLRKDGGFDQREALGLAAALQLLGHLRLHLLVAQFAKARARAVQVAGQLQVLALDLGRLADPQVQLVELASHLLALAAHGLDLRGDGLDLRFQRDVGRVVGLASLAQLVGPALGCIGTGAHRPVDRCKGTLELHDVRVVVGVLLAQQRNLLLQQQQLVLAVGGIVLQACFLLQGGDLAAQPLDVGVVVAVDAGQAGQLQLQRLQAVLRFQQHAAAAEHRHRRLGVGELALQVHPALLEEDDLAIDALDLGVRAFAAHLIGQVELGQAALVAGLEGRQLLLQLGDVLGDARQFLVEEQRGLGCLLLAVLDVLVQVERGQLVGDLLRVGSALAVVGQAEGDRRLDRRAAAAIRHLGADRRELDVAAHAVEDLLAGLALPRLAVQRVLVDQVQQRRAGHHLLADHLDALVGEAGHGGAHELLRNFLLLDQDRRGRSIDRRQQHRHRRGDREQHGEDHQDEPPAPTQDAQVVAHGLAGVGPRVGCVVEVLRYG